MHISPHPGFCYDINPKEPFWNLRNLLHATSVFDGVEIKRKIEPHMTIAEIDCPYEKAAAYVEELQDTLRRGQFLCDSIDYAVPNENFYFERVMKIPLEISLIPQHKLNGANL